MASWAIQPRLTVDIGWRDLVSTLRSCRESRSKLEAGIVAHAPPGLTAVVGLSVRTLFDALLAELRIEPEDRIVAGAVNIADMARLIRDHGGEIVPVDLSLDTLAVDPDRLAEAAVGARMVLIAHLYGTRCPVPPPSAGSRALWVEDCAQAFDGRLDLSETADVALYSFGPIKTATALGGGVAVFRDPDLAGRVRARLGSFPARSDAWFLRRAAKYALLKALSAPVAYGLVHRLVRWTSADPDAVIGGLARGFDPRRPLGPSLRHAPPRRMLRLLARRLSQALPDPSTAATAMDRIADHAPVPGRTARPRRWWLAPILVDRPAEVIAALARRGFDATQGATSLGVIGEDAARVPEAVRLIEHVVYLPRPTRRRDADRLCDALADILAREATPPQAHARVRLLRRPS